MVVNVSGGEWWVLGGGGAGIAWHASILSSPRLIRIVFKRIWTNEEIAY